MKIAFDGKRIYQNSTGLGNYSRTLVESLAKQFAGNEYYLLAPKITSRFQSAAYPNCHVITPSGFFKKLFKGWWRSRFVKNELQQYGIDLYHGLSHEIPFGIQRSGIKSVVTMHDLIFERYPHQYNPIDRIIYRYKCKNACNHADHIIAISEQTKHDIIEFYQIDSKKISVCYQSCDAGFYQTVSDEQKKAIQRKYNLPEQFFLYVGSVIERKNLLNLCKALLLMPSPNKIPLVVIGKGGKYLATVKDFVQKNILTGQVIFLYDTLAENQSLEFSDFPAIYQSATAMIYPSVFEGFGIPILEAMASGIPVITSNLSCMPEVGGDAAIYIDPYQPTTIAAAMTKISQDPIEAISLRQKGIEQAKRFNADKCAQAVMDVYVHLIQ
jgi:glycosyltransferase involved in cell wall biosynthesis